MTREAKRAARDVRRVEDLEGGEVVRLDAGTFRITHARHALPDRWAILLDDQLRETGRRVWLAPRTRVLEVVSGPSSGAPIAGGTVDPLSGSGL